MRDFRLSATFGRLALGLVGLATVACAGTGQRVSARDQFVMLLDSIGRDTMVAEGPGVVISTDYDAGRYNRVVTRLHSDADAYVAVVNVSPGGVASIVYPESPDAQAFLRGGRTYLLPSYFTGYQWESVPPAGALGTRFIWYGRSVDARLSARGPGYLFAIASRAPLDLDRLAEEGYFDGVEVGTSLTDMEPDAVIPHIAVLAIASMPGRNVSIDYARYSGYDAVTFASNAFQSAHNTAYCNGSGAAPFLFTSLNSWDSHYALSPCNPLDMWRMRRHALGLPIVPPGPIVRPPVPDSGGKPRPRPGLPSTGWDTPAEPDSADTPQRRPWTPHTGWDRSPSPSRAGNGAPVVRAAASAPEIVLERRRPTAAGRPVRERNADVTGQSASERRARQAASVPRPGEWRRQPATRDDAASRARAANPPAPVQREATPPAPAQREATPSPRAEPSQPREPAPTSRGEGAPRPSVIVP